MSHFISSRIVMGVCYANWPFYRGMSFSWIVIEYFKSHSFSVNHLNGSLRDMPMKKMDRLLGINILCHKISISKKYREHVRKPTHFHKLNYPCHWWMPFMPSPLIFGDQLTFVSVYIVVLTNGGPPGDLIDWTLTHWGRVTHICDSRLTITGSENGLSLGQHQAIIWTNAGILLIGQTSVKI